jgi:hypothetical protein
VPDGGGLGLYTGNAGIGVFLLYLGEAAKDARFRKTAEASFARVLAQAKAEGEGLHWEHSSLDIIGGEAGIGLGLLAMHEKTKNPKYLAVARKAAKWLAGKAEREGKALRWKKYGAYDAGFSHGASGVAFFLHLAGDTKSARSGADWVASVSRPRGKGAILWEYYAGEPPKGKSNWIMNSWCHGAPGTVRIFTLLHRRGGGKADLETAIKGGGGIRFELRMDAGKPRYFNPTYCCGASAASTPSWTSTRLPARSAGSTTRNCWPTTCWAPFATRRAFACTPSTTARTGPRRKTPTSLPGSCLGTPASDTFFCASRF